VGEEGDYISIATLSPPPLSDSCIKVGSDVSHVNVSLNVGDNNKKCPQITTLEKKGELKRIRTEVPLLKTGIYGHIWKHGGSNIASKYALCMGKQKIRLDSNNFSFICPAVSNADDNQK